MKDTDKDRIEALAAIVEYATSKEILDQKEIKEIEGRLDVLIASLNEGRKFFKRLM